MAKRCVVSLPNVLDPRQLSIQEIAQLYARRWDIELALLTLKELLGMHHWWSGKPTLILQQIWAMVLIAQVLQAVRMLAAAQAGVDPFDISLALLIQYLPDWLAQGIDPVEWIATHGRRLGFIRPSTRYPVQAPQIPVEAMAFPPSQSALVRKARYVEYKPRPQRRASTRKRATAVTKTTTGKKGGASVKIDKPVSPAQARKIAKTAKVKSEPVAKAPSDPVSKRHKPSAASP